MHIALFRKQFDYDDGAGKSKSYRDIRGRKLRKAEKQSNQPADGKSENYLPESDYQRNFSDKTQRCVIDFHPDQKEQKHYPEIGKYLKSRFVIQMEKTKIANNSSGDKIS